MRLAPLHLTLRASKSIVLDLESRRSFHDYFITHIPKSAVNPDAANSGVLQQHLPGATIRPQDVLEKSPRSVTGRDHESDTATVRIPIRGAKHHFGAALSRGSRPYNEDAFQAGVIDIPTFAYKPPTSVVNRKRTLEKGQQREQGGQQTGSSDRAEIIVRAEDQSGPQTFYFGVFDGHGGAECSGFLREELHSYVEEAVKDYRLSSTLQTSRGQKEHEASDTEKDTTAATAQLQTQLVKSWRQLVGGYYRRFNPSAFKESSSITTMLTYAFLKADYDFIQAQMRRMRSDSDSVRSDSPINISDINPHTFKPIPINQKPFKGGSTCSTAFISTPTPTPFWNPSTTSTVITAHCGDTRILLSRVFDGAAVPLTTNHHPSTPSESTRLRRFATSMVTDSFGEERLAGLANTRAFGDIGSKGLGVIAEPEITRTELGPSEYAFMCLMSDGVSGTMNDQEIVDVVKEAKTPEQGARDVVSYATEVSEDGDNATCLVVRLGGWERRQEGGGGSLRTKDGRDWKRREAQEPRGRRD